MGNGRAHATIQCGAASVHLAENCNLPCTHTRWKKVSDKGWRWFVTIAGKELGQNVSQRPCCRSLRNSGWRQSHIIPHLSLAPRKTCYSYISKTPSTDIGKTENQSKDMLAATNSHNSPCNDFMKSLFSFCHWFWGIYYFWIRDMKSGWHPRSVCEIISWNSAFLVNASFRYKL